MAVAVKKFLFNNGATLLIDREPRFASVACSVSLLGGSRDESLDSVGLSHVLEHLLLKRTRLHSTLEIAQVIDELGGDVNAFTDATSLSLHGTVPSEQFPRLREFFTELLTNQSFLESDLETEKEVIRQEILEANDDPAGAVYSRFSECLWPRDALGLPVFGHIEVLSRITIECLKKRLAKLLCGRRIIIGVVGDVDVNDTVKYFEKCFGVLPEGCRPDLVTPKAGCGFGEVIRSVSQAHIAFGRTSPGLCDDLYLPASLVASLLGQGMSSRLFQLLREERGLAYDVGVDVDAYPDISAFSVSAVVERKNLDQTLELIVKELRSIVENGVCYDEFRRAVCSHKSQLLMENDGIGNRLWRAVDSEFTYGRYLSAVEEITELEQLKHSDITSFVDTWSAMQDFLLVLGGDVEGYSAPDVVCRTCGID